MPRPTRPPSGIDDSWTDDLTLCPLSGIGHSTNIVYKHNGQPTHDHEFEDIAFRFQSDDACTWLYGIFDGHDGKAVADYAAQRLPAEIMLGQLAGNKNDDEVKEVLKQAFASVERGYFAQIGDLLARRTHLLMTLPENMNTYELAKNFPEVLAELKDLNRTVSPGSSGIVALILDNRLFVANVGNCRALLCKTDIFGHLRVIQLNSLHDIDNPDEVLRLTDNLGMSVESVRHVNNHPTRCLGDFPRKGGYKDHDCLREAKSDPVTADPDVYGGFLLDETCKFLILISSGVSQAVEAANPSNYGDHQDRINPDVAALTAREFGQQATLTGVAQAVVDEIARRHNDAFFTDRGYFCQHREDMTVLVRKFNYAPSRPTRADLEVFHQQNTMAMGETGQFDPQNPSASLTTSSFTTYSGTGTGTEPDLAGSTLTSEKSEKTGYARLMRRKPVLKLDDQGRIEPYVDFSEYFEAVQRLRLEND